jgi:type III restriction enzyme
MKPDAPLPIQPVAEPILCSPYAEPDNHWVYDLGTGVPRKTPGRRQAQYWFKSERTGSAQMSLRAITQGEEADDLPLVNALREDVRRWRQGGYENASETTKKLLRHWWRSDRARRLFFCQLEAVETIIYLREILHEGRKTRWSPKLTMPDYRELSAGRNPRPEEWIAKVAQHPKLLDRPVDAAHPPLVRYAAKMATGSGKTVVMAMLIAWAFCNRGRNAADRRYPRRVLVVCPNKTIHERLQVLRASDWDNYYDKFDLVPSALRPELAKGKVLVTNWHIFNESSETENVGGLPIVQLGPESEAAFAKNRLRDLVEEGEPLLVLNDEGHHAYRPAPVDEGSRLSAAEREEREEATVWISGVDKINAACGVAFCVDLSATPFYIGGSGYPEGSPFPWIVSDFGLVDAIESGITKIPRLPAIDNTGRPDPKYFRLWDHITTDLKPGERLSGGKPKPEVVYAKAQDALITLASEWKEKYLQFQAAAPGQERVPPVMIVICDNTDIAKQFYEKISGEDTLVAEIEEEAEDEDDEGEARKPRKKAKPQKRYGAGLGAFPELWNSESSEVTLRIDAKLLAEAESEDPKVKRSDAAQQLRKVVATVGRPGLPGEAVRCVVSVNMLSEGWDANNVTHILGVRAFLSQLLCEQVVGRGLRRMDYTPDPTTGLLTPEYVDIFGVPFSLIPFKGRQPKEPAPADDRPKNEVRALDERAHLRIEFPNVEGYVADLRHDRIRCDVDNAESIRLDPSTTPNAAFVRPQVGYQRGEISAHGGFGFVEMNRDEYHSSVHPQEIRFMLAAEIIGALTEKKTSTPTQNRTALFPQVLRIVERYVATRVDLNGEHPTEIGLETYARRIIRILTTAIEPDAASGEANILPRLNRYQPIGSTNGVHFKTVKPVQATQASHVSHVAADTTSWEQAAAFQLEKLALDGVIESYVRNDHLEFNIPLDADSGYVYEPDFLLRVRKGLHLVLEIKGFDRPDVPMKSQATKRWLDAVNHWGRLGRWDYRLVRDPQRVGAVVREVGSN